MKIVLFMLKKFVLFRDFYDSWVGAKLQTVNTEQFEIPEHSILKKKSLKVNFPLSKEDIKLIIDMKKLLYKLKGGWIICFPG